MKADSEIALEHLHSEMLGALMSIQSYRDIRATYFDRLKKAVADAATFFGGDEAAPPLLINELNQTAAILRNEAAAFAGRTRACLEMAEWLESQAHRLVRI